MTFVKRIELWPAERGSSASDDSEAIEGGTLKICVTRSALMRSSSSSSSLAGVSELDLDGFGSERGRRTVLEDYLCTLGLVKLLSEMPARPHRGQRAPREPGPSHLEPPKVSEAHLQNGG